MQKTAIQGSELILNEDGSIYHLHLQPEHLCDTILTVGDPDRVAQVSKYFDVVEDRIHKREFVSHIGRIGQKRLMVISTGIGTDNVDIVLNELDALANIDLNTREPKTEHRRLQFVRLGTSGSIRSDLAMDTFLVSDYALGIDGLMLFYPYIYNDAASWLKQSLQQYMFQKGLQWPIGIYPAQATPDLVAKFQGEAWTHGITLTATGFYGPQGRSLRLGSNLEGFFEGLADYRYQGLALTNLEMETAAIYALAEMLGHEALGLNVILAERRTGRFSTDPAKAVENLIQASLELLTASGD